MQGAYPQAIEYYKKSLQDGFYGNEQDLAVGYGNLGSVYRQQGDFSRAIEAYHNALELHLKIGEEQEIAKDYVNLGTVYGQQGKYDLAMEMYQKALEILLRLGDQ
jgi:tetratricopeptide (TPR) repeat protein